MNILYRCGSHKCIKIRSPLIKGSNRTAKSFLEPTSARHSIPSPRMIDRCTADV